MSSLSHFLTCSLFAVAYGNQFLAKSLGSHMVLQQNVESSLYGWSKSAASVVSVLFQGTSYSSLSSTTVANSGGFFWKVSLPPVSGGFTPYTFNITSSAGEYAFVQNVKFGDVFLCSGQSNMQMGVPDMFNAAEEIKDADNYPDIRLTFVYTDSCAPQATSPLDDLFNVRPWCEASSTTVDVSWGVSGVCWMYAKYLYNDILSRAHPVGLVISDWGGTTVMAWAPQSVTDKCVQYTSSAVQAPQNPDKQPLQTPVAGCEFNPNAVGALYNTMIAPFKDMSIKGGLWYQGESDVWQAQAYACLQDGMVSSWRELWGADFTFIFTQLSTWDSGGGASLANFRLMQESIVNLTPRSAMITAADLGDPYSPAGDIHPRNKSEIGRRMSLAASSLLYGKPVAHMGPRIKSYEILNDEVVGQKIRVSFTEESVGSRGLYLQAAQECPAGSQAKFMGCGSVLLKTQTSAVEASLELWVAEGSVVASSIVITPSQRLDGAVTQVSYCQGDYPLMTVFNDVGVPLVPFVFDL